MLSLSQTCLLLLLEYSLRLCRYVGVPLFGSVLEIRSLAELLWGGRGSFESIVSRITVFDSSIGARVRIRHLCFVVGFAGGRVRCGQCVLLFILFEDVFPRQVGRALPSRSLLHRVRSVVPANARHVIVDSSSSLFLGRAHLVTLCFLEVLERKSAD